MHCLSLLQGAEILKAAEVLEIDLTIILAPPPTSRRVRFGEEEPAFGIAPQLGDRMQIEADHLINIFLLRKVAVHRMIFDLWRQAMTLRRQLLLVKINPGLFLFLRRGHLVIARRRLCHGQGEGAAARDIDDSEGGNLQPTFGAGSTAAREVAETESLLATLRNEGGILHRDHFRVRTERLAHDLLMKARPVKGAAELSRDRAFGIVAVAAQIAKVDAAPQRQDRAEQNFKELPLRLTNRRHLLQDVVDNCHRPLTV